MRSGVVAYCPSCSASLGTPGELDRARDQAVTHCRVTGHVVQLVDAASWSAVESVYGEPGLPLWDSPSPEQQCPGSQARRPTQRPPQ